MVAGVAYGMVQYLDPAGKAVGPGDTLIGRQSGQFYEVLRVTDEGIVLKPECPTRMDWSCRLLTLSPRLLACSGIYLFQKATSGA